MEEQKARRSSRRTSDQARRKENFPEETVKRVTSGSQGGNEVVEIQDIVVCRKGRPVKEAILHKELDEASGFRPPIKAGTADVTRHSTLPDLEARKEPRNEQEVGTDLNMGYPLQDAFSFSSPDLLASLPAVDSQGERLLAFCNSLKEQAWYCADNEERPEAAAFGKPLGSLLERFAVSVSSALGVTLKPVENLFKQHQHRDLEALGKKLAELKETLQAHKKEEAEWLELQSRIEEGDLFDLQSEEAEAFIPEADNSVAEVPSLQAASSRAHKRVQGLQSMLSYVEALKKRAEAKCTEMQAEYHAEKFRTFAHVDSPARLINKLVKAQSSQGVAL